MSTYIQDKPALERLTRARTQLLLAHPFFGAILLHQELRENAAIETMGVDGKALHYNPGFVTGLTEAELIGVLWHETMHLVLLHHTRRGRREMDLWNKATDYAINARAKPEGFTLPKAALLNPAFDGQGAEQIYAALAGKRQQEQQAQKAAQEAAQAGQGQPGAQPSPGQGQPAPGAPQANSGPGQPGQGQPSPGQGQPAPGQGQGQGQPGQGPACPDPGGCGGVMDAAPDAAGLAAAEAETEAMVRQAVAVTAKGAGTMPGGLARILDELNEARVDWREVFGRFIDDAAQSVVNWSRPDKRFLNSGFYLPGRTADAVSDVVAFVDTSGSIQRDAETAFATEVQAMLDTGRVARVHVVSVDSKVQGSEVFELGDSVRRLKLKGGGGTRFDVAFDWLAENVPEAAAVIYLTDLDVSSKAWGQDPGCPVLWAVTGRKREAPFGEVVPLDPYQ